MTDPRPFLLGLAFFLAVRVQAEDFPKETATFKASTGSHLVNVHCLTCHSADYVTTQPPSAARAYWNATVLKMKKAFGAPIPDDQVAPIVDYLVKNYGDEQVKSKN